MSRFNFMAKKRCGAAAASVVAAAMAFAVVGCSVDSDYDLSKLDTDSIGLGTDTTVFDIPLATVTIDAADFLISDEVASIVKSISSRAATAAVQGRTSIFEDLVTEHDDDGLMGLIYQINSILPSDLSGDYANGVEIARFAEVEYVAELVEAVVHEYATDYDKMLDFCEMMLVRAPNYPSQVAQIKEAFGVDFDVATLSATSCADTLTAALNDEQQQAEFAALFRESIIPGIMSVLAEYAKISVEEELVAIEIDDSIYDIIAENLDGESNYLQIGAAIDTNLPFGVSFDSSLVYEEGGTDKMMDITSVSDYSGEKGVIDNVDVLRAILEQVTIKADVSLNSYAPEADMTLEGKTVVVTLMARKSGSIKF